MKRKKSIGLRILYGIAAVSLGLVTWYVLAIVLVNAFPNVFNDGLGVLIPILAFALMGYFIYRWAIR